MTPERKVLRSLIEITTYANDYADKAMKTYIKQRRMAGLDKTDEDTMNTRRSLGV